MLICFAVTSQPNTFEPCGSQFVGQCSWSSARNCLSNEKDWVWVRHVSNLLVCCRCCCPSVGMSMTTSRWDELALPRCRVTWDFHSPATPAAHTLDDQQLWAIEGRLREQISRISLCRKLHHHGPSSLAASSQRCLVCTCFANPNP